MNDATTLSLDKLYEHLQIQVPAIMKPRWGVWPSRRERESVSDLCALLANSLSVPLEVISGRRKQWPS